MTYTLRGILHEAYLAERKYIDDEVLAYLFDDDIMLSVEIFKERLNTLSPSRMPEFQNHRISFDDARTELSDIVVFIPFSTRLYIRTPHIKQVFIPADPFSSSQKIPEEAFESHDQTQRDFFHIGERDIWYATYQSLKEANIPTEIYCPSYNRIQPHYEACKQYLNTIHSLSFKHNITYEIKQLKLNIEPYVRPYKELSIMSIFNNMQLSNDIPFASLATPYKRYYKLHKDAYKINGISEECVIDWIHDETIPTSSCQMQVRIANNHFGHCTLQNDGSCQVFIQSTETKEIRDDEYHKFIERVHYLLKHIETVASPKVIYGYPSANEETICWMNIKVNIHFTEVMDAHRNVYDKVAKQYNNMLYRFEISMGGSYDAFGIYDVRKSDLSILHLIHERRLNHDSRLHDKYLMDVTVPEYDPDSFYHFSSLPQLFIYTLPSTVKVDMKHFQSFYQIELFIHLLGHIYTKEEERTDTFEEYEDDTGIIEGDALSELAGGATAHEMNLFLPKLKDLDSESQRSENEKIFKNSTYTITCQGIDSHPVPISDEQKEYIDKYHPQSYHTSKQHHLYPGIHFICPEYWCPTSNVPITKDEKCPLPDEEPIKKSDGRKLYPANRPIKSKIGTPLASSVAPCCKIRDTDKNPRGTMKQSPRFVIDETASQADREFIKKRLFTSEKPKSTRKTNYIPNYPRNLGFYYEPSRLPLPIDEAFEQRTNNEPKYVMYGIESHPQTAFLNSAKFLLRHESKKEFSLFTSLEFLAFQNGATVQAYSDPSRDITDPEQWQAFAQWCQRTSNEYIRRFQLQHVVDKIKRDIVDNDVKREFMIYRSYCQFYAMMINDDIPKSHDEVYDCVMLNRKANPYKNIFLVLDGDTEYDNRIGIHCPLYYTPTLVFNPSAKVHMIVKHTTENGTVLYNPIVWESRFSSQHKIYQFLKFNVNDPESAEYRDEVVSLYESFMGGCCHTSYHHPQTLENIIKAYHTRNIRDVVVSSSFTVLGLRTDTNSIIPYPNDVPLASFLETKHSFVYLCDALREEMTLSLNEYQDMLTSVCQSLKQMARENNERDDIDATYTVEKNAYGYLRTKSGMYVAAPGEAPGVCSEDLMFLTSETTNPEEYKSIQEWRKRERQTYNAVYKASINAYNDERLARIHRVSRDPLNPYPLTALRQRLIDELLPDGYENVDKSLFATLLMASDIHHIANNTIDEQQRENIIFDETDVQHGRVERFLRGQRNPYKTYETTENTWIVASPNKWYTEYVLKAIPETITETEEQRMSPNTVHDRWFRNKFMALRHTDGSLFTVRDIIDVFVYAESYMRKSSISQRLLVDMITNNRDTIDITPSDTAQPILDSIASKSIVKMISQLVCIPVMITGKRFGEEHSIRIYGGDITQPSHFLIFNYVLEENMDRGYVLPVVIKGTRRVLLTLDDIRWSHYRLYENIVNLAFE